MLDEVAETVCSILFYPDHRSWVWLQPHLHQKFHEISLKKSLPILAIEQFGQAAATAASAIPV